MIMRLIFALFVGLTFISHAQSLNHYVVVGAFSSMDNAVRYTSKVNKLNFSAQYAVNPAKQLYYVYLLQASDPEKAYAFVMKIRVETQFKDAWIFRGRLGRDAVVSTPPVEEKREEPAPPPVVVEVAREPVVTPTIVEEKATPAIDSSQLKKADPVPVKPAGKPFLFKLVYGESGNPVVGEVHVMESARAADYIPYQSNEVVYLPAPKNRNGTYQIKTLAPGYKEMKRAINYTDPAQSAASKGSSDEFVIALPLVRVKQGDYIEFSNVRFHNNSAVLQPEARNELTGLATLLNENTSYRLLIHGHCNGGEARDITMPGGPTDIFTLGAGNVRESGASAKKLTLQRAETVKAFLVSQGVDGGRIKTKGEGGSQGIYPKGSTLSSRNDRVEVEVKKGK